MLSLSRPFQLTSTALILSLLLWVNHCNQMTQEIPVTSSAWAVVIGEEVPLSCYDSLSHQVSCQPQEVTFHRTVGETIKNILETTTFLLLSIFLFNALKRSPTFLRFSTPTLYLVPETPVSLKILLLN